MAPLRGPSYAAICAYIENIYLVTQIIRNICTDIVTKWMLSLVAIVDTICCWKMIRENPLKILKV